MKPHFKIIAGRPVSESKIDAARRKFGQPFAHEPNATWKPRSTFYLSEWLANHLTRSKA